MWSVGCLDRLLAADKKPRRWPVDVFDGFGSRKLKALLPASRLPFNVDDRRRSNRAIDVPAQQDVLACGVCVPG